MAVTDIQFTDHANQNNAEFSNRRIVIKGTGNPTGSTIAPKYAKYINESDNQEFVNHGTISSPNWVAVLDASGKEDVGVAQAEIRGGVVSDGDTLYKLYQLILSLGSGLGVPQPFDANTETLFPAGVSGDAYIVTVAGTVDTVSLGVGDLFWTDTTTSQAGGNYVDWYILPSDSSSATETVQGLVELATQGEAEATSSQSNSVVLTALRGWQQILAWWSDLKTTTGKDLSEVNFTSTLNTKLSGIESEATADQTASEIEALYEGISGNEKFSTTLKDKLVALTQASEEVTRYTDTISGHSFSVGNPIGVNHNTNAYVLSESGNDNITHFGFVTNISGDDVTISLNGLIDITGWGLSSYTRYYLDTDGSLINTDNGFPILQTITSTKAVIIVRGSGGGGSSSGATSTPYYVEGVFDGTTNQVDLGQEADDILVVSLGGIQQRRSQFTIDNSGANTIIIFEDTAIDLNGLPYNIVYINNAVFGEITIDWSQIANNPIPNSNNDDTYYLRPSAGGGYELAVLPSSATAQNLQSVTGEGSVTTDAITIGGLSLSNYSTRKLLFVDVSGEVKQVTLDTELSLDPSGVLSGNFLPLSGGTITGDLSISGQLYLAGISGLGGAGLASLIINTSTNQVSYKGLNIDDILTNGANSDKNITVNGVTISSLSDKLLYTNSSGNISSVTIGSNLSFSGGVLSASGVGGGVTISGTPNYIPKYNATGNNIEDSQIRDDGTSVSMFTSPISGSAFRVIKNNTTNLVTFGNTSTSGTVFRLETASGGSTRNFIEAYQGATKQWNVDSTGKGFFKNLNISLSTATTQPLQLSTSGNVLVGKIDYSTQIDNLPTIPAAQVPSDWNAVSGVSRILNKPSIISEEQDIWGVDFANASITTTLNSSKYYKNGKLVLVFVRFAIPNSTGNTDPVEIDTLPFAPSSGINFYGTGIGYDGGSTTMPFNIIVSGGIMRFGGLDNNPTEMTYEDIDVMTIEGQVMYYTD